MNAEKHRPTARLDVAPRSPKGQNRRGGCWFTVRSDPAGVPVLLDGETIGHTPIERVELTPGEHRILTADPGIHEVGEAFTLQRGEEKVVQLAIAHREGGLRVRAEDDEGNALACAVRLNGSSIGPTTWSGQLWIGDYNWVIDCGIQGSRSGTVTVTEQQIETVTATFPAATTPGWLSVHTIHPGVEVTANGTSLGFTPIQRMPLAPGTYRVAVQDPHVQGEATTAIVLPAEETAVLLPTALLYGQITVRALDANARDLTCPVKLDGERVGNTPFSSRVSVGEHLWNVRCESLGKKSGTIRVFGDQNQPVVARFHARTPRSSGVTPTGGDSASGFALIKDHTGVSITFGAGVGLFDLDDIALKADSSSDEHPAPSEYEGTAFPASALAPANSAGALISVHLAVAPSFFRLGLGVHAGFAIGQSGNLGGLEIGSPMVLMVAGDIGVNIPLTFLRPFAVVRGAYCYVASQATPVGSSSYFYYDASVGGLGFAWGIELIPPSDKHWLLVLEGMAAPPIAGNAAPRIGVLARVGFGV